MFSLPNSSTSSKEATSTTSAVIPSVGVETVPPAPKIDKLILSFPL